jgi:hypothetical protein
MATGSGRARRSRRSGNGGRSRVVFRAGAFDALALVVKRDRLAAAARQVWTGVADVAPALELPEFKFALTARRWAVVRQFTESAWSARRTHPMIRQITHASPAPIAAATVSIARRITRTPPSRLCDGRDVHNGCKSSCPPAAQESRGHTVRRAFRACLPARCAGHYSRRSRSRRRLPTGSQ